MSEVEKALEAAHQDYEHRRAEIYMKLLCIRDSGIERATRNKWLTQAIDFIKEKEI